MGKSAPTVEATPIGRRLLGAVLGNDTPTFKIVAPRRSAKARLLRWVGRLLLVFVATQGWRLLRILFAHRRRRLLHPWRIALGVWIVAALLHLAQRGWVTALAVAAVAGVWVWQRCGLPAWRFTRRRRLPVRAVRGWYGGAYLATSGWAVVAAKWGPGPPRLGYLMAITVACWVALCWHLRTRRDEVPALTDAEVKWTSIAGLEKTTLLAVEEMDEPRRVRFDIDLTGCDLLAEKLDGFRPQIAKKFGVPQTNVMVGYRPDRLETKGQAEIVLDNPCNEPVVYDERWFPTDAEVAAGIVPFHLYPNGQRGYVRLWYPGREPGVPGAGGVMSVFTGDIGSGKSAGMSTLLTQATMTGRAWPMAGCPQGGASFPAWAGAEGQAAWKAACDEADLDPIMAQLLFLREALYDRTNRLAKFRWVDKWGDQRVGLSCWDYDIIAAYADLNGTKPWPLITAAFDELWRLMLFPEYAEIVKELLKLARKAGIDLFGATQYPGLEEFNNDAGMRQPLVSGNVLCYRNSDGTTKSMILDKEMPGPNTIPAETPEGRDTKGTLIAQAKGPRSSVPNFSRSVWVERDMHYAKEAATRIHPLEPELQTILRKYVPEGSNVGYRLADIRATENAQPMDGVTVVATPATSVRGTILERALQHLATLEETGYAATSGAVAAAIGEAHPSVSGALTRAVRKDDDRLVAEGNGVYRLSETARPRELAEAAA